MAVKTVVHCVHLWFCTERFADAMYTEDRAAECNGSRPNSPAAVAAEVVDSAVSVLWQHGVCKWPGCDTDCDNPTVFIRSSPELDPPMGWVGRSRKSD